MSFNLGVREEGRWVISIQPFSCQFSLQFGGSKMVSLWTKQSTPPFLSPKISPIFFLLFFILPILTPVKHSLRVLIYEIFLKTFYEKNN